MHTLRTFQTHIFRGSRFFVSSKLKRILQPETVRTLSRLENLRAQVRDVWGKHPFGSLKRKTKLRPPRMSCTVVSGRSSVVVCSWLHGRGDSETSFVVWLVIRGRRCREMFKKMQCGKYCSLLCSEYLADIVVDLLLDWLSGRLTHGGALSTTPNS